MLLLDVYQIRDYREQQRLLLKPKCLEIFDSENKFMLEEKSKNLRWVVGKVPFLRDIEIFRTELFGCWKRTFRACKSVKTVVSILSELSNLDNHLKTENFSDSKNIYCAISWNGLWES